VREKPLSDRTEVTVLVQGGAGAVGQCAVQLTLQGGARVIAVVRSRSQVASAREAGASDVVIADEELAQQVRAIT
jgi:NADPH2:quinone reductase